MSGPMLGHAPSRHAAAFAVAIALGVGVALMATSAGAGPRAKVAHAEVAHAQVAHAEVPHAEVARTTTAVGAAARSTTPVGAPFPDTPAGAVAAATAWCQNTGEAFFEGTWGRAVKALSTPSFLARAEDLVQPASSLVHRRLAGSHMPYANRLWPLGYSIQQYASTVARVRVWQLDVFESPGFNEVITYQITTVSLAWTAGDWKATDAAPGQYLPPPGQSATASQVAGWITSVDQLSDYTYAP